MPILLFLISFITRFIFLYWGFPSITHDEADYYLNGYVLSKTGTNLAGDSFFLTFGSISRDGSVPVYLSSLFFRIFPKTVFFSRLPFALLNSFIPVLIYLIIKKITKNDKLSFITFLVVNFSPWFSYLSSQSAYNSPLAFLFFLLMILTLLTSIKKKYKYLLFLLFSFLAFNSYMGIKMSFVFLVFISFLFKVIFEKKKVNLITLSKIAILSFITTLSFTAIVYLAPRYQLFKNRYVKEIIFFNNELLENKVWYERLVMESSNLVEKLLANKLTASFDLFAERYLSAFNPYYLFIKGDPHPIYGTHYFGLFYLFELFLIFAGIVSIWEMLKKKQLSVIPILLIFIFAPLPTAVSTIVPSFALRSYPLLFPFSFIISAGFVYLWKYKKFYIPSFLIYLISFLFFLFIFQYKIKVLAGEQWFYGEMILSKKIYSLKDQFQSIYVITPEPKETLYLYNFYNEQDGNKIKRSLNRSKFFIDNVNFEKICPPNNLDDENLYIIKRGVCKIDKKKTESFIEAIDKSGTLYYKIKNKK